MGPMYSADGLELLSCEPGKYSEIRVKEGVKKIRKHSMMDLDIGKLYIPPSVVEIGGDSVDGAKFWSTSCTAFGGSRISEVVFGEGTGRISQYAFDGARVGSVKLPNGLKAIGQAAFLDCGLEKVALPDGIRDVFDEAFNGCQLREIAIPGSLWRMGWMAFGRDVRHARLAEESQALHFIDTHVDIDNHSHFNRNGHASFGHAILIESANFKFAMPSNVHSGKDFRAFRSQWFYGWEMAKESAKYAYRLAENAVVKQDTALMALGLNPGDTELRKYVTRFSGQIAERHVAEKDADGIMSLVRLGVLKKPKLEMLVDAIDDGLCKAYIMKFLEGMKGGKSTRL